MGLLFLLALLLAWPTFGLSLVAWVGWFLISAKKQPEQHVKLNEQMPHAQAERPSRVPSWAGDRQKNETFIIDIQRRAMIHGVPQPVLHAMLARKETFASLVSLAAKMESQGFSFLNQQIHVSKMLVEMWKLEGSRYGAGLSALTYLDDDGKSGPPSWSDDEDKQRNFATGVQILAAPDGLTPEALNAMFSLEQPLKRAVAIAGAVERQGGSFKDQQLAVKNFMVNWWSDLAPNLQETFSDQFRY